MGDDKDKASKEEMKRLTQQLLPAIQTVDERVLRRTEEEIERVVSEVLHPYLLETIPPLMRKLNHQGVFDKVVRAFLEEYVKQILGTYVEGVKEDLLGKIDRKFKETFLNEYEPKVEQAAKKLLDEALAKVRREFVK
jgi:uncharacterized membrane protein YheB (UPF0754 family)